MNHKKSKKLLKSSRRYVSLGISTNIAVGALGFRADLDIGPKGEGGFRASRVVLQDKGGEGRGLPVPGTSTPGVAVDSAEHWNCPPTEEDTGGTREEQPAETSKVSERGRKDTAYGAAAIPVDVTKGPTDGFGPLKAVLVAISAVYADYKEIFAARNKIEDLLSRITTLEALFAAPPNDVVEQRRRNELIRKFKGIEEQLQSLCEKPGSQWGPDHALDVEDVFSILEDLQEATTHYQVVQQLAVYDQGCESINPADAAVLNTSPSAQGAEYRHGGRTGCLKGTRRAILDQIEAWKRDFDRPPVYWLNGLAGTGKTTVAQTTADRIFSDGQLGASFFCSRDFEDRSNLQLIFPTLAIQLARRYNRFRSILVPLLRSDPTIVHESLYGQMDKLIVQPLIESAISTVIVIDALDECKDEESASAILSVLGQFVAHIPKVKFFLTGRPEPRIREGFRLPLMAKATDVFVLHEVELSQVNSDIRLFFRHKFSELKNRRRGLDDWPAEEQLDLLCERAAGLFVHAVATVKFIDRQNSNPRKRLELLLQTPGNGAHEGKTKLKQNTTLDSLYMSILQEAFGDEDPEDDPKIRSVLGAVILVKNPLSPTTIAMLLGFDTEDVSPLLSSVHSLLVLQEDADRPVRPFHKSFPDFIADSTRCLNQRFLIFPPDHHAELLVGCLKLMNRKLEKNICKLPDSVINSEVDDLKERVEQYIDHGLRYACRSWHKHLVDAAPAHAPEIAFVLHQFLEGKFLFWLEVLSVLGAAREAVDALEAAAKWLDASLTLDLVDDYFRFVIASFDVISTSAPHIYHSALPLSPETSIVRSLYKSYARPLAKVVHGLPVSWESSIATKKHHGCTFAAAAWSPCGRLIAVAQSNSYSVEVRDPVTLERINTFNHPPDESRWVCFSPDSRSLELFSDNRELASWDLQTGGQIGSIPPGPLVHFTQYLSSTYSADGNMVAVAYLSKVTTIIAAVSTFHLPSRTHVHAHRVTAGYIVAPIWTHGERVRYVTVKPGSITIWELEFSPTHKPAEVESLPAPDNINGDRSEEFLFLPPLSRLAFTCGAEVLVWDARGSKLLLKFAGTKKPESLSFSPDGRFFACGTAGEEIYLWKDAPAGYVLHQKVMSRAPGFTRPLLSPDGESILVFGGSTLQLWRTADPINSRSGVSTQPTDWANFILEFSPDGTLAAVVRVEQDAVTVLDLESGDPRLTVNTGMNVLGVRITESAIVVIDEEKVVIWELPAKGRALNVRANINNSVRTTLFDYPAQRRYPLSGSNSDVSISPGLNYVAVARSAIGTSQGLHVYDATTGKHLGGIPAQGTRPWFTQDGREIWCYNRTGPMEQTVMVKDSESGITTPVFQAQPTAHPSGELPWGPPCNYEVTDDGWVLGSGKRLLWLPHRWRSGEQHRTWNGRFLGLMHRELPEAVILQLDWYDK